VLLILRRRNSIAQSEKALGLFSELRNRGTLMPADSGQAAKFVAKIRECDTAIAQLTTKTDSIP
jgi:hypothetical protein